VLAEPEKFGAAAELIERLGYRRHECARSPRQRRHYARQIKDIEFRHARTGARLELHRRILAHLYSGAAWYAMPRRNTLAGYARYSLWQRLYRLSFKPDWRYRFEQVRREWFTAADWDTLPLSDSLFFLYPPARTFAWIGRRRRR
jgi:hypothetical protein